MEQAIYQKVIQAVDEANVKDPNVLDINGIRHTKEQLYSHHMLDMLMRFYPDADKEQKIAVYAQHIKRWQVPRSDFPMNKTGYYQWRCYLYDFHAEKITSIMKECSCSDESIARVRKAVAKQDANKNGDTQLLEDIAALVFIEHYMENFASKHTDYDEQKWLNIIRRTWNKMSEQAKQFALSEQLNKPSSLLGLISKAIA